MRGRTLVLENKGLAWDHTANKSCSQIQTPSLAPQLHCTTPLKFLPPPSLLLPFPPALIPSPTTPNLPRDKALWDLQVEASARWLILGLRLSREMSSRCERGSHQPAPGRHLGCTWCGKREGQRTESWQLQHFWYRQEGEEPTKQTGRGEGLTTGHTLATCLMPTRGVCAQCVRPVARLTVAKAHYPSGSRASHSPISQGCPALRALSLASLLHPLCCSSDIPNTGS